MKMNCWQRIEALQHYTHLNTNAFAKSISLKRSENLYQIKKGNNGISKELTNLITNKYPEINKLWVLTGDGPMLLDDHKYGKESTPILKGRTERIPYYDIDMLSVASGKTKIIPSSYYEIPIVADCDFAIKYSSNSMSPVIEPGSIIFVKKVDKSRILLGELYLILTKSFATVRYIDSQNDVSEEIKLIPSNKDHKPNIITSGEIDELFLVVGCYRPFV